MELTDEQVKRLAKTIDMLDQVIADNLRLLRPDHLKVMVSVQDAKAILQPEKPREASKPPP